MHPNFPVEELREFVHQTLTTWHVPGAALAVVQNGEVILCEGFGLRDQEKALPVTQDTIFPIASCTKAFTAMCIGLLVDEGELEWDKPVRHYMPAFKLQDDFATERMTPRDLLCHRSGLPRHDLMWYFSSYTRQDVFNRLQYLEPNKDLRATWQYQNMMYMMTGVLIEEVTGLSWEEFIQQRIFEPLGMARSNTSTTQTQQDPDHGRPYLFMHGELKEIPYHKQDADYCVGPAGTINSCVRDMANWLLVHTSGGRLGEKAFISPHNLEEMHKPHIFIDDPEARQRFGFEFLSYGLGWFLRSYKGQMHIQHGGTSMASLRWYPSSPATTWV